MWDVVLSCLVEEIAPIQRWQGIVHWLGSERFAAVESFAADPRLLRRALEASDYVDDHFVQSEVDVFRVQSEQYASLFLAMLGIHGTEGRRLFSSKRLVHLFRTVRTPSGIARIVKALRDEKLAPSPETLGKHALTALNLDAFEALCENKCCECCMTASDSLWEMIRDIPDAVFMRADGSDSVARSIRWLARQRLHFEDQLSSLANNAWNSLSEAQREFLWFSLRCRPLLSDPTEWKSWTPRMLRDLFESTRESTRESTLKFVSAPCFVMCLVYHGIVPYDSVVPYCQFSDHLVINLLEHAWGGSNINVQLARDVTTSVCEYFCKPEHRVMAHYPDPGVCRPRFWMSWIARVRAVGAVQQAVDSMYTLVGHLASTNGDLVSVSCARLRGVAYWWSQQNPNEPWEWARINSTFAEDLAQLAVLGPAHDDPVLRRSLVHMTACLLDHSDRVGNKVLTDVLARVDPEILKSATQHSDPRIANFRLMIAQKK